MSVRRGVVEWTPSGDVSRVPPGREHGHGPVQQAAPLQRLDARLVSVPRRTVQRRAPLRIARVALRPAVKQQLHTRRVAAPRRHMQRRAAGGVFRLAVNARGEQRLKRGAVAPARGGVRGRRAAGVARLLVRGRVRVQKRADTRGVSIGRGGVQRGHLGALRAKPREDTSIPMPSAQPYSRRMCNTCAIASPNHHGQCAEGAGASPRLFAVVCGRGRKQRAQAIDVPLESGIKNLSRRLRTQSAAARHGAGQAPSGLAPPAEKGATACTHRSGQRSHRDRRLLGAAQHVIHCRFETTPRFV